MTSSQRFDNERHGSPASRSGAARSPSTDRVCEDGATGQGGRQARNGNAQSAERAEQENGTGPAIRRSPTPPPSTPERPRHGDHPHQAIQPSASVRNESPNSRVSPDQPPQRRFPALPRSAAPNRRRRLAAAPNRRRRLAPSNKNTAAHLKISSENIKGRGSTRIAGSEKWKKLADGIAQNKIGIMAVQETHLLDSHVDEIHRYYPYLHVLNTEFPNNASGAAGVALIFNKRCTNTADIRSHVLVPGRAIAATFNWHRGDELTVLAIYAPTDREENRDMWENIENKIRQSGGTIPKPDILLGDFNFVEDALDRFPAHLSRIDAPETFDSLKRYLGMYDGWRDANPATVEWTWRNPARTALSRIDRIYVTRAMLLASRSWEIETSGITKDDHSRISVEVTNLDMPEIGPGRWAMQEALTQDKQFLNQVEELGKEATRDMSTVETQPWTAEHNAQTIWAAFKAKLGTLARRRQREINCARLTKEREAMLAREEAKRSLQNAEDEEERQSATQQLREAETRLHNITGDRQSYVLAQRSARARLEGEQMTKSWFGWTRKHKPRDTVPSLYDPNIEPHVHISDSKGMADLAGAYHREVQMVDLDVDPVEREQAIRQVLDHIELKADTQIKESLSEGVSREGILESLKSSKNGSAAGSDGIIYEFWKAVHRRHQETRKEENQCFDVIGIMVQVFTDIEKHGVLAGTGFAEGWMCPIYKKGDRTNVANYRPITLLNTDYKIYTKSLALKLARAAPKLIHKSQAGFVKGRSITDQTKLTSLIRDYAEATEENGMIIALDQEKAYDRVRHDCLIKVLEEYGLPEQFVRTISSLYGDAHTAVMVNGVMSERFRITRGVRQGDPLSCLLFNLAIEPLSSMLRRSTLLGYEISGLNEKLIASLYADDTTVYLSEQDSYETLGTILERWCLASGAKFNVAKTEIIPLGTEDFRKRLRDTRRLNDGDAQIPQGIRIAADGEPTRILGSWPGNRVGTANAWSVILDRVERDLARWNSHHPTMHGKSILSQTIAGGYTQYLTAAGGMPLVVQKKLDKLVLDFFWEGTGRHPINMEVLRRPREFGGLNLFSAEERNEAQYIVWVGAYVAPPSERPLWAYLADEIFRRAIRVADRARVPADFRINPFCQSWRPNKNKLPFMLRQMMRVADKYHLVPDAPYIAQDVRKGMSAWAHPAMLDPGLARRGTKESRCLRKHHAVRTLDDLEEIAEQDEEAHVDDDDCDCENCTDDRLEGCRHPASCQRYANDLLGSVAPKWNLATEQLEQERPIWEALLDTRADAIEAGESLAFDQGAVPDKEIGDIYRIFVNAHAIAPATAADTMRKEAGSREPSRPELDSVHAIACGSTLHGRTADARGGFAVTFADGEYENRSGRCPGKFQSEERSAAVAILETLQLVPPERTLHIVTNSKSAMRRLTTQLRKNEDSGWLGCTGAEDVFRATAAALRRRGAETTLMHVSKNRMAGWLDVRETRRRARAAARAAEAPALRTAGLDRFDVPGLKAANIKQRTALRAIKLTKMRGAAQRRATLQGLTEVRNHVKAATSRAPTDEDIWRATRDKDTSRNVRNFQWKGIHGAHKVGSYFSGMPAPWDAYAICATCGETETMEHILTECPDSAQATIWNLAGELLGNKIEWEKPRIGQIWGAALADFRDENGVSHLGANRAYKIIVSESAFLAWKIRCEKRIEHEEEPDWAPSVAEVERRWYQIVNTRIAHDRLLTNKRRYKRRALKPDTVLETWDELIEGVDRLTLDILRQPGVLVGTGTSRVMRGVG